MNRLEFLARMRKRLEQGGLPEDDINDALSYYEEVFLDAGEDHEIDTAESMGEPEDIARDILIESGIHPDGDAQFPPEEIKTAERSSEADVHDTTSAAATGTSSKSSGISTLIKLLILVLTFPIWLPILILVVVFLFVIIVVAFSLVFGFLIAGVSIIFGGIRTLFEAPFVGMMMLGGGLLVVGLFVLIAGPVLKRFIPGAINLFRSVIDKLGDALRNGGRKNG